MLTDEAMDDLRWKSELIGGVVPIRPEELRDLLDEIARLRAENELQATLYCAAIDDLTSQNDKLRAENERLKAARLRSETVRAIRDALSSNSGETEAFGDAGPWEIAIADLNRCYTEEV